MPSLHSHSLLTLKEARCTSCRHGNKNTSKTAHVAWSLLCCSIVGDQMHDSLAIQPHIPADTISCHAGGPQRSPGHTHSMSLVGLSSQPPLIVHDCSTADMLPRHTACQMAGALCKGSTHRSLHLSTHTPSPTHEIALCNTCNTTCCTRRHLSTQCSPSWRDGHSCSPAILQLNQKPLTHLSPTAG